MPDLIALTPGDDLTRIHPGATITPLTGDLLRRHLPDVALALVGARGQLLARASCWWSSTPPLPGHRVGLIGHYAAEDDESARTLLDDACERLEAASCTCAVGPMDGNTWRSYRFVVEPGDAPPFFLEPVNPPSWPAQFTRAGFSVLATYSSAIAEDLSAVDGRIASAEARLREGGIAIRPLRLDDAEADLRRIFALSLDSFTRNFMYTPLSEEEFLEQNWRLLPFVQPDLVLLAERSGNLAGFLFSVPDVRPGLARPAPDAVIIKTVAVSPGIAQRGLGSVLVAEAHRRARALGFTRAIHALMHEQNVSRNISQRYATTMRRYALFVKPLAGGR